MNKTPKQNTTQLIVSAFYRSDQGEAPPHTQFVQVLQRSKK